MPEFTAEKPHAITCIKNAILDVLKEHCGNDLTVSCDRDDCWSDSELFKHRQAVNVVTQSDTIGESVKGQSKAKSLSDVGQKEDRYCKREAILDVDITVFVEQCECDSDDDDCDCLDAKGKAYSIMAHIISTLISNQHDIPGRRVLYTGSTPTTNSENDTVIAAVTGRFQVHYIFDQTRPWVVG